MHTQGSEPVMHRDIKPANILLGNDNRIWLIDFGLAKEDPLKKSSQQIDNRAAGSVGYAPMEQWFGETAPTADIYAAGTMFYQLLVAERFCAAAFRCLMMDLPPHGDHPAEVATYGLRHGVILE